MIWDLDKTSLLAGALAMYILRQLAESFMPSYFKKKGENLATKEDIAKITTLQEEVKHKFSELQDENKHQYAMILEEAKQRYSIRTLIATERVAAHQQAFVWIHKLLGARDNDEVIEECNSWAMENCLYLTSPARQAFFRLCCINQKYAKKLLCFCKKLRLYSGNFQ